MTVEKTITACFLFSKCHFGVLSMPLASQRFAYGGLDTTVVAIRDTKSTKAVSEGIAVA